MIVYSLKPKQITQRPFSASKTRKGISLSVTQKKHFLTPTKKIGFQQSQLKEIRQQETAVKTNSKSSQTTNLTSGVKESFFQESFKLNSHSHYLTGRRFRAKKNVETQLKISQQISKETMAKLNEIDSSLRGIIAFTYRK